MANITNSSPANNFSPIGVDTTAMLENSSPANNFSPKDVDTTSMLSQEQPTPTNSVPSSNVIDTTQAETVQKDPVLQKEKPETERFVPDLTPEETELSKSQAENDSLRDEIKSGLEGLATEGAFTAQAEEDAGLVAKREAKTAIDNQIREKQRQTDLALRKVDDTFGTRAQKTAEKNEIINKSNNALADLAIIQLARAGELGDAQATVDRKVELAFQDKRAEIDAIMFMYQENKERFTLVEQREFENKLKVEEREYQKAVAKTKQLEDLKLQMLINANEAGAGTATLQGIQNAKDVNSLMSLPNAGTYTQSKADRLSAQLASINVQTAQKELDLLNNPTIAEEGLTPELQKTINGLGSGERTALVDANDTVRSMERLKELIATEKYTDLATVATDVGREFNRLSLDVADKMARERTGAVVNPEEMKTFKKVLGLTLFNRTISSKEEVIKTLNGQITKHNESQNLVDPTGEIRSFLNSNKAGAISTTDYLDEVDSSIESGVYSAYDE